MNNIYASLPNKTQYNDKNLSQKLSKFSRIGLIRIGKPIKKRKEQLISCS